MKKILLLTDFSEASHHALLFACSLFSDTVADFHLLCVHSVEPGGFYSATYVAQLRLQAACEWHTFRASAMPGKLIDVVRSALQSDSYDLVVMGAKKDGANELFGNSATTLIRTLEADVLVVPVDAPIRPVHRIVLATDFAGVINCKRLEPLKTIVTHNGAILTMLTIDTPGQEGIHVDRERQIRQFLSPLEPALARLQAPSVKEGIRAYLDGHTVDLLVAIPAPKSWTDSLSGKSVTRSLVYAPDVPVLTLYDDGYSNRPRLIEDLSNLDYAL